MDEKHAPGNCNVIYGILETEITELKEFIDQFADYFGLQHHSRGDMSEPMLAEAIG